MKKISLWLLLAALSLLLTSCSGGSGSSDRVGIGLDSSTGKPGLVSIETVAVGNPGNASDPETGCGAVSYEYAIGKYLVTIGQYVTFLNAKAAVTSEPAIIALWNIDMEFTGT